MKLITPIISTILVALVAMPVFSNPPTNGASSSVVGRTKQQVRITDEQIMGIIIAVDKSEIAAANIAGTKKIMKKVSHYAHYLKKQHTHNLYMIEKLAHTTGLKPMKSVQSIAIAKDARSEGAMLSKLNGKEFESAYIDAMVKGHAGGLKLINTVLLKEVTNAKLKHFVKSFRALVTRHLEEGKRIQASM